MTFSDLKLNEQLLEALGYMGFNNPTPIQEQAIPLILKDHDLIACAQTGTGKTGAFVIPVLHKILSDLDKKKDIIRVLIVVPTRELAIQIDQQIDGIAYGTELSSLAIYGGGDGDDFVLQKNALKQGVDIVIATPGKLISHLNLGYVDLKNVSTVILDEADRMLDIGFHDDMLKIFSFLPSTRQTLMFSATMPPKIRTFAKKILNKPEEISLAVSKPAEKVLQIAYLAHDNQKTPLLLHLLKDKPAYNSVIIFTSTKKQVGEVVKALKKLGIVAEGISSNLIQSEREDVMLRFRNKKIRILVATDVISRGIDVKDINLVVNYTSPKDPEDYVHRIGRTARADTEGIAITLVNEADMHAFARTEELIEKEILKLPLPPELGEGPVWNAKAKPQSFKRKPFKRK
ncbi:MAG: ATP-dependent RNA helicase RhlE [Flavobacteriales bacterium]|jgi:ATP-dependent RNA helicase RhlE